MKIQVISLFPEMFSATSDYGVIGRAIKKGIVDLSVLNPRGFADDKHKTVDSRPYGGGPGMIMLPEPLSAAIAMAKARAGAAARVAYLSPQGRRFDHSAAVELAQREHLILLAGRYEGVDERVIDQCVDEQWSIGDYVLSGGELPAMVMIDAICRLLPDSLGNKESALQDSFVDGLLDCPHYARPEVFAGQRVPAVLLSGDHAAVAEWREQQSLGRTWLYRPDLLDKKPLTKQQTALLDQFKQSLK